MSLKDRLAAYKRRLAVITHYQGKSEADSNPERRERRLRVLKGFESAARKGIRNTRRKLRAEAATDAPRIVPLNLPVRDIFGPLGPELYVTGHYTAGPVDTSTDHAIELCRRYHAEHAAKGWGGIGYHYCIARDGTLLLLRSVYLKGAHVGGHNTSNVGVMCHGTTGDRPTEEQADTFRWLLANAHTDALPRMHRTDRDLRSAQLRGHRDWMPTACPGGFYEMYLSGGTRR